MWITFTSVNNKLLVLGRQEVNDTFSVIIVTNVITAIVFTQNSHWNKWKWG